jgi:hypothetical protein
MLISINQTQPILQIYKQVHHGFGGAYQAVSSLKQIIGINGMVLNGSEKHLPHLAIQTKFMFNQTMNLACALALHLI